MARLVEKVMVRLDSQTKNQLVHLAKEKNEDQAEVARQFIKDGLERHYASESIDYIQQVVTQAVSAAISPSVERMAKIGSKNAIASTTASYMLYELISRNGVDAENLFEESRKKAIQYVKKKELE